MCKILSRSRIVDIFIHARFKYKYQYEKSLKNRYSIICEHLQLNYNYIEADPIDNSPNSDTENFINKKVLTESNYYKDLLIKKNKFLELISNF